MKEDYNIIFVVLVYRNLQDLQDFFAHNKAENSHTVVVNSFYDEKSENNFRKIASNNGADFISVPNNGYGAGNNAGVKYVLEHYDFKYLIISNADVIIEKFDFNSLQNHTDCIIAPKIVSINGKKQNPCAPFKPTKAEAYLTYLLYKGNHRKLIWIIFAYSRLKKILFNLIYPMKKNIFSAHGAFVIFPKSVLETLAPLYNEKMFLFKEEAHVAMRARKEGVSTVYLPSIVIKHKEDGSMKVASINVFNMERQSYMEYYNNWFKR